MKKEIWIFNGGLPATVDSSIIAIKDTLNDYYRDTFVIKEQSSIAFQKATPEILINTVALIIMPGGAGQAIYKQLGEQGNQTIKNYVKSGGRYLGICAGAYYGAEETKFEIGRGEPYEINSDTNAALGFYPGIAHGVAYEVGVFIYQSEAGARIAKLSTSKKSERNIAVYFNGGCYFVDAENRPNTKIIARYADLDRQPAAIVQCQYGNGIAILSGVHFEYRNIMIDHDYADKCIAINNALNAEQKKREQFVHALLMQLLN